METSVNFMQIIHTASVLMYFTAKDRNTSTMLKKQQ